MRSRPRAAHRSIGCSPPRAEELLNAQVSLGFAGGTIDGTVVTRHPVDAIRERGKSGVPLVVGTNRDEGTLFTLASRADPDLLEATSRLLAVQVTRDGDVDAYLAALSERFPDDDAYARANRVWVDLFRRTAVEAAAAATEAGPGGWLYRLDLPTTVAGDALGATHSADVTLTFNWLASERPMGFSLYDRRDDRPRSISRSAGATRSSSSPAPEIRTAPACRNGSPTQRRTVRA